MRKDSLVVGAVLVGLAALVWFKTQANGPAPLPVDPTAGLESWQVVKVSDGDSITVERDGEEQRLRLCGIDAPEKDQALGPEATAQLQLLLEQSGGWVMVDAVEQDRYGRTVAEVWSEEEGLINGAMVTAGMAFVYERYVGGCPSREAIKASGDRAEEIALGVWAAGGPEKPWEWRKAKR